MSIRKPIKKSRNNNPTTIANRKYKQYIYELCRKVQSGDNQAELELKAELDKNSNATWAVKHFIKVSKRKKNYLGHKKLKKRRKREKPLYGNFYKLYQGGSPGLGKRA